MSAFKKEDLEKIKKAVQEAEQFTSGEIVPVIAARSNEYSGFTSWLSVMCFSLCSLLIYFVNREFPFWVELPQIIFFQFLALIFGVTLSRVPLVLRFFMKKSFQKNVHERALVEFMQLGLQETKDRTGVLIYISELEQRVEILADKGIHLKLGDGFWRTEVQRIVAGIRAKDSGSAVSGVIIDIGQKLQEHFPRKKEDKNELGDSVIVR